MDRLADAEEWTVCPKPHRPTSTAPTAQAASCDRRSPSPLGPHEVRLDVVATSLNFRDLYFIRGNSLRNPSEGSIPLSDAVGRITEIGSDVTRFAVGDRACSTVLPKWLDGPLTAAKLSGSLGSASRDGVLRSRATFDESELVRAPDFLTDAEAATLPIAALTAWHATGELGVVGPGTTVVIQTTGGVALFALQFAHALGAKTVVVARSPEKLERARDLGATVTIDSTQVPDWEDRVLEITDRVGADLVLDMGLTDSLRRSVRAVAYEGTVAVVGVVQEQTNPMDIYPVMNKNVRIRGVESGSRAMFERMVSFIDGHRIRPVIDSVHSLDAVDDALDRLSSGAFGKVVLAGRGPAGTRLRA